MSGTGTAVLIAVHNRAAHLRLCLQALERQTQRPDEVVVADDGSDVGEAERMAEAVRESLIPARLVRQERQGSRLAAARNLAIREAKADYLVFIDSDILLLPDALAVHRAASAPGRLLVGNRAWLDRAHSEPLVEQGLAVADIEELWRAANRGKVAAASRKFRRNVWLRSLGLAAAHKPKLLGCHFSLHRADILRVNGFDENYTGWGLEDDDLSRRLHAIGVEFQSVIRTARALHIWHPPAAPSGVAGWSSPNESQFRRARVEPFCAKGVYPRRNT